MQNHAAVLMDVKMEKYKNIWEESDFYWTEINGGSLQFDRRDVEVKTVLLLADFYVHRLQCFFYSDFTFCHGVLVTPFTRIFQSYVL